MYSILPWVGALVSAWHAAAVDILRQCCSALPACDKTNPGALQGLHGP